MLHSHIRPSMVIKKDAVKRKKGNSASEAVAGSGQDERKGNHILSAEAGQGTGMLPREADSDMVGSFDRTVDNREPVTYSADKGDSSDWSFMELAEQAKRNRCDMLSLLKGKISITEIAV